MALIMNMSNNSDEIDIETRKIIERGDLPFDIKLNLPSNLFYKGIHHMSKLCDGCDIYIGCIVGSEETKMVTCQNGKELVYEAYSNVETTTN